MKLFRGAIDRGFSYSDQALHLKRAMLLSFNPTLPRLKVGSGDGAREYGAHCLGGESRIGLRAPQAPGSEPCALPALHLAMLKAHPLPPWKKWTGLRCAQLFMRQGSARKVASEGKNPTSSTEVALCTGERFCEITLKKPALDSSFLTLPSLRRSRCST